MRASIIFSAIFVTAVIAAPILDSSLQSATDTVSIDVIDKLEGTVTGLTEGSIEHREDNIENAVPAGDISRRLIDVEDLVDGDNDLLTDMLDLTSELEATLVDLIEHAEDADIVDIVGDVESLVRELLAKTQEIVQAAGLNLDMAELNPVLATMSDEIGDAIEQVQSLADAGDAGDAVDEVKGLLNSVLMLINNLVDTDTLV